MNKQTQHSLLKNFFSAYFHQDWPCEADSVEAIVDEYKKTASRIYLHALGEAILEYSESFVNDGELEEKLFTDLGCYYSPKAEGISAKVWLGRLADKLRRS